MKVAECRRLALQLATMLPEKKDRAFQVYEMLGELISSWIFEDKDAKPCLLRREGKCPVAKPKLACERDLPRGL